MRRSLALLVLFTFAFGLMGLEPCAAQAARRAVLHCHAMAAPAGIAAMAPAPLVHGAGHGCCGLPGQTGDSSSCERACCLLAVLYTPPALAAVGPSDDLPLPAAERGLSLFVPSIDHIPLS